MRLALGAERGAAGAAAADREPRCCRSRRHRSAWCWRTGCSSALVARRSAAALPVGDDVAHRSRACSAFTAALAMATGILFGLAPALQASKPDVVPVLKNEIVPSATGRRGLPACSRSVRCWSSRRSRCRWSRWSRRACSCAACSDAQRHRHRVRDARRAGDELQPAARRLHAGARQLFYEQVVERAAGAARRARRGDRADAPLAGGLLRSVFPEGADTTTRDRILVQVNSVGTGYFADDRHSARRAAATSRAPTPTAGARRSSSSTRRWRSSSGRARMPSASGSSSSATRTSRPSSASRKNSKYNGVAEDPHPVHLSAARAELHAAGDAARARRRATRRRSRRAVAARVQRARSVAVGVQRADARGTGLAARWQPLRMNVHHAGGVRRPRAAAGVDRALRRRELLGDAAHARDRRAHGARRAAGAACSGGARPRA